MTVGTGRAGDEQKRRLGAANRDGERSVRKEKSFRSRGWLICLDLGGGKEKRGSSKRFTTGRKAQYAAARTKSAAKGGEKGGEKTSYLRASSRKISRPRNKKGPTERIDAGKNLQARRKNRWSGLEDKARSPTNWVPVGLWKATRGI